VRWIFLAFGFGVLFLAWSQGHLKLDGSGRSYFTWVPFLFVTIGLLVGLQPSIESTFGRCGVNRAGDLGKAANRVGPPWCHNNGIGYRG
jgi:hypothetical protein